MARAQAQACLPYMVIIAKSFKMHCRKTLEQRERLEVEKVRETQRCRDMMSMHSHCQLVTGNGKYQELTKKRIIILSCNCVITH